MKDLNYQLKRLCRHNRDGSYATQRDRELALSLIADRLLVRLEQPILFGDAPCRISASIGITVSDDYADPNAETMLNDADRALYASKNAGRAQHTFVSQIDASRLDARVN